MQQSEKREAVFELIHSLTKAEKRNFKLYAGRLSGNRSSKYLALFDALESMEEYDEERLLARCPELSKVQLPNQKAHLYRQILKSLRLISVQHSTLLQIREQADFARILYDKGLYSHAGRMVERAVALAEHTERYPELMGLSSLQRAVSVSGISADMVAVADGAIRRDERLWRKMENINRLSRLSVRCFDLHQRLGYARSQKDMDLLSRRLGPELALYKDVDERTLSFSERFYLYQSRAWFNYIRHGFALSYRYARKWIALFDERPEMKEAMYEAYLKGYAQLLDGLYLMRRYSIFTQALEAFEAESATLASIGTNADMLTSQILFTGHLNKSLMEGNFKEGLWHTKRIDSYLRRYGDRLTINERMMLDYKIGYTYFLDGNYDRCRTHLSRVIAVRDPQVRRDLQCYARMLNLIVLYEQGADFNLDQQVRSVYSFIVKMRDMTEMKQIFFRFFKSLGTVGAGSMKQEFQKLYDDLRAHTTQPYERRFFYYLDLPVWLESRITGRSIGEITRNNFEKQILNR
ncbi:MAG: hypothetical protein IKC92_02220 [Tidjanibacter sp.]|nr:hypothetical protein [Tidjanibacter sp.]